MLESIFNTVNISLTNLLICISVSIIIGLMISLTHMKTTKYTRNFIETLAILPLLVSIVILMVNGNLGTGVAVAGAFSLVRFRSIPGTSKEIMSVFFAMTTGLSLGMGHIVFSLIITIIGCLFIIILSKFKFDLNSKSLVILVPEDLDYTEIFNETLTKYSNNYKLEKIKTTNMGSLYELSYLVTLKDNINIKEFIDELRTMNGNLKISLKDMMIEGEL